jgi:amino acid adenylation domain-containing protein
MTENAQPRSSMVEALRHWASIAPDKAALIVQRQQTGADSYSYSALDLHARRIAAALQAAQLTGERVLLQADGFAFVAALYGCFYAGAIPVPAHQPKLHAKQAERFKTLVRVAQAAAIIGSGTVVEDVQALKCAHPELADLKLFSVPELLAGDAGTWRELPLCHRDIAYLQFTSGSTSDPKGVVVDHGNLVHNMALLQRYMHSSRETVAVSWLPLFHDLGLIAGVLHPLFLGGTTVLMTPMEFIRRPIRWLRAISDNRATLTGAPNFGFAYAAERIKESDLDGIDLSSLRVAFNGAEPVRLETLNAFSNRFARCGFTPEAFAPCYGLAEATLAITGKATKDQSHIFHADKSALEQGRYRRAADEHRSRALVSCGTYRADEEVVIVDADNKAVPDGVVGEIWNRGPCVARGYWNNPTATAETFGAYLQDGRGPFLRTGDLGFLHDGELIITGRRKSLVIIRGRNFYPHDLEQTVSSCHEIFSSTGVAVVGVPCGEYGQDMLVVVAEARRGLEASTLEELFAAVNTAISEEFDLVVGETVLIGPGTLLKTSSGKIRHAEIARRYQTNELGVHARSGVAGPTEQQTCGTEIERGALQQAMADALRIPAARIGWNASLRSLGLDSLRAAELSALIEERWQRQVSLAELMGAHGLKDVAALIERAPAAAPDAAPALALADEGEHLPFALTPMQQAYWVGSREIFELGGRSLHGYFETEGCIDVRRFEAAWNRLIRKHAMLRAVIDERGEQRVLPEVPWYTVNCTDLRAATEIERERSLADTRARMSNARHELTRWPWFELHASVLPSGVRMHYSIDGIFLDFRSFQLVFAQLAAAYEDVGFDPRPPRVSFKAYVDTIRRAETRSDFAGSLQFWRAKIGQLAPPPQLPLEREPASLNDPRVVRREQAVSREQWRRIAEHAAAHGLTPASVLLTAYGRVLALWSYQQRLTVNVPLFNRPPLHSAINDVIGNFSTFTLVDMDFSSRADFMSDALRVQKALHEAIAHSRVSGVQVLREINSREGCISGRGFPVVFTHLPVGLDDWDGKLQSTLAASVGRWVYSVTQTPQVWIDCQVWYEDGGVQLSWDSIDALFPEGMVDEMFAAYCASIVALSSDDAWLGFGEDLLPKQAQELLGANNSVRWDVPATTVVHLIEQQARKQPDNIAVVSGGTRLTYAQLIKAADHYAARLKIQGAGRGSRVAIVMRKGWEQAVAVLAVLRAGSAYVPIDPDSPAERLRYLLKDCGAAAVMVQPSTAGLVPADAPATEIVDDTWRASRALHSADVAAFPAPSDLVYVIYTSGTSGQPKGVMVSHRNLISAITVTNRHFEISDRDSVLAVTALSHDMSVFDLLGVLAAGGKVVLPKEAERRDPGAWLELLHAESITLWNSVPALLEMLLDYVGGHALDAPRQLRLAWIGGDWVTPALVRKATQCIPGMTVCSVGGPTETTLWNIWHVLPRGAALPKKIPYGRPAPNNRYYILNGALAQCPVWVTGEMYCAGDGVSQGYLNSPERTGQKFVWHDVLQERLYRTGDLGRLLPDGTIEFMGRADFQIKVQGVRIEAGEIEAAILKHCAVSAAVVTAVGEGQHKSLAAYVVPARGGQITGELESYTGAVITATAERISFKLARKGLRQIAGASVPLPGRLEGDAGRAEFLRRQSIRRFESTPVETEQLGKWLAAMAALSLEKQALPKYRYPSGGGLYAVQLYIYVRPSAVQGLDGGYYYYDPDQHRLCVLTGKDAEPEYIAAARPIAASSAFTVFLVAALDAIEPLYGQLAQQLCLLEAGYMSQLLMEEASRHSLGLCPIGFQSDEALRAALQLGSRHVLLHTLIGGPIARDRLNDWLTEESAPAAPAELSEQVTQALKLHLPAALIPKHVITLARLPLTANGKVDRMSLPAPQREAPAVLPGAGARERLTETQRKLSAIWAELLGHGSVGVNDNFFEIGGNSNLLVQFHVRLNKDFDKKIAIAELFRCSTIRELATLLDETEARPKRTFLDFRGRRQREAARRQRAEGGTPHG